MPAFCHGDIDVADKPKLVVTAPQRPLFAVPLLLLGLDFPLTSYAILLGSYQPATIFIQCKDGGCRTSCLNRRWFVS